MAGGALCKLTNTVFFFTRESKQYPPKYNNKRKKRKQKALSLSEGFESRCLRVGARLERTNEGRLKTPKRRPAPRVEPGSKRKRLASVNRGTTFYTYVHPRTRRLYTVPGMRHFLTALPVLSRRSVVVHREPVAVEDSAGIRSAILWRTRPLAEFWFLNRYWAHLPNSPTLSADCADPHAPRLGSVWWGRLSGDGRCGDSHRGIGL